MGFLPTVEKTARAGSVGAMKSLLPRTAEGPGAESGAELDAMVATLFRSYPALYGFSVQPMRTLPHHRKAAPLAGDLFLADVEFNPWLDREPPELMLGCMAKALLELIDECPPVRELLRGRTFARSSH